MLLRVTAVILSVAAFGLADTVTLRDGRVVRGEYVGGDARHIKIAVGDRVDTIAVDDVDTLQFGSGSGPRTTSQAPPPPPPSAGFAQQAPPANVSGLQIAIGTPITVRMIDSVNSEQSRLGETFHASVDEPVIVNGQTVIPRGADALAKLVQDQQSGKFEGRTVLTLVLQQVMINGQMVNITTGDVTEESKSRGSRTAKVVGGTTAVGAIIGAIAGGGKGAAIGAGSGAAVGAGAQAVTKGQVVKIPSETRLTFTVQQPVQL